MAIGDEEQNVGFQNSVDFFDSRIAMDRHGIPEVEDTMTQMMQMRMRPPKEAPCARGLRSVMPPLSRDFQGGLLRIQNPLWVFLRFLGDFSV